MKLSKLLNGRVVPESDIEIRGLTLDSRQLQPGDLFIALNGENSHGLAFCSEAKKRGACAVIYDPAGIGDEVATTVSGLPSYPVEDLSRHVGEIAARFYGYPSRSLTIIGVTGTNGKTSCSQFLAQLLPDCGVIGTLGWGRPEQLNDTLNTTPDAVTVQRILARFVEQGLRYVAMEVSSHGLAQGRVVGVEFSGALFTNLSRDHLDYHGSMTHYLAAKMALLQRPELKFRVVNRDDDYAGQILQQLQQQNNIWGFGRCLDDGAVQENIQIKNIECNLDGSHFELVWRGQRQVVDSRITGQFNIENMAAVATVLLALGWSLNAVAKQLKTLTPVAGRMETLGGKDKPIVVIDYAHTPDALAQLLANLKQQAKKLTVVFGCGGNRDQGKRSLMGEVASQWADYVIVTDDNPRFEASEAIIADILQGCVAEKTQVISDRHMAISRAIAKAQAGDCVVIAGKGHEQYQDIQGVKTGFSDQSVVRAALERY
ncbi:UDP-N-acetylmuramoyl-L-alanyl-D-glutamate--2,6-diaminopimelate ligase [methane-oxidizing endosymbiont of Gigantopelta aegis]|uniref:UDP-N-acetylmuramoyl-L-alanyl-D-glutamate--2, 6-diaminopimelate ligase n=1 Tax=methane-oxidizing endosymbiont of Gigantopelta aegis TaxID=2794938 RepID=UPI0018DE8734|nr:UDP-N-acetylmuramoyl-L-alanyl-D-glutamate--2,6-diaminopimelate ligase [methane-oxidizing endosymbiont of Gigantopelta aegis]